MIVLSVKKLAKKYNPLLNPPWNESYQWKSPLYKDEILELAKYDLSIPKEYDPFKQESREDHMRRVAYYVKHGYGDSCIELNFNWPWPITDGNHRLASAIIRGDTEIFANWEGAIKNLRPFIA